jgi:isoamylase
MLGLVEAVEFVHQNILCGRSFPIGATVYPTGVNFCVFSNHGTAVELLLFETAESLRPHRVLHLDPKLNRTHYYWHVFVPGVAAGQVYAYRVSGPFCPEEGHRFNPQKVLLDPYAKAVVGWENYSREAAILPGDNCAQALKGVVVDPSLYDWEGDTPLHIPYADTVIYELHVGGFTKHPSSGMEAAKRGTYAGLIEKIPYLKQLGITAVELMPIHQFDRQDARPGLMNYWGYSTLAFFSPHRGYSSRKDPMGPIDEFRDMVKAFHQAGIEVILDVVFNHTAEGDHTGPTMSFKGLENRAYYILENDDSARYANYSGCGNTMKANHEVVSNLILDCLRYWVAELHVDGFRFDLASVFSRGKTGAPIEDAPLIWAIEADPVLAGTKIIAEAWDAAGLYEVGNFAGDRFAEWNGPYRDDVRRFIKGDGSTVWALASRITGSPDIYLDPDREINRSINFVTCHDGFTLNDLVAYNEKHNNANGEDNRDGANDNASWNCGVEGPTQDAKILELRLRQMKNLMTVLFMSQGTPMLSMGDEVRRTQQGNNNAYCQDNPLSWFDWDDLERHQGFHRFVQGLIQFHQTHAIFAHDSFLEVADMSQHPHITWHGVELDEPDWGAASHSLALTLQYPDAHESIHVMLNAYWDPMGFELPQLGHGNSWRRIVDTSLSSPEDFCAPDVAPIVRADTYWTQARSVVVLLA